MPTAHGLLNQEFSKGAKGTLESFILGFYLPPRPGCHGVWKKKLGGVFGDVIVKTTGFFLLLFWFSWGEEIWGYGVLLLLPFVSYTRGIFLLLPRLQTFQGWAGKKAASLRTVYCSGFSNGVTVIKKQKAKTQSNQTKAK